MLVSSLLVPSLFSQCLVDVLLRTSVTNGSIGLHGYWALGKIDCNLLPWTAIGCFGPSAVLGHGPRIPWWPKSTCPLHWLMHWSPMPECLSNQHRYCVPLGTEYLSPNLTSNHMNLNCLSVNFLSRIYGPTFLYVHMSIVTWIWTAILQTYFLHKMYQTL